MGQPRPRGPTRVQGKCCGVGGGAFRLEGHRIGSGEDCGGDSSGASCDPGEGLSLLPPPPCPQLGSGHNCPSPVQFPGALGHDSDNDNNEDKVQGNKTLSAPTCAMPSTLSARLQLTVTLWAGAVAGVPLTQAGLESLNYLATHPVDMKAPSGLEKCML